VKLRVIIKFKGSKKTLTAKNSWSGCKVVTGITYSTIGAEWVPILHMVGSVRLSSV